MVYLNWPDGRRFGKSEALAELGVEISREEFFSLGARDDGSFTVVVVRNGNAFEAALVIDSVYALQVVREDCSLRPCRFFWVESQEIKGLITV